MVEFAPIAIGNTTCMWHMDSFRYMLCQVQLGCRTKASCKVAVHAMRTSLNNASEEKPRTPLKLDYRNAFKSDRLPPVVYEEFLHLYPFVWQA